MVLHLPLAERREILHATQAPFQAELNNQTEKRGYDDEPELTRKGHVKYYSVL